MTDSIPCLAFGSLNLRSSSDLDADHGIKNSILNFKFDRKSSGKGGEGWTPNINDKNQFVIASTILPRTFTQLDLQGSGDSNSYITSFIIRYSLNNKKWYEYKNGEILKGNTDSESIVSIQFNPPIVARSISIHPQTWKDNIGLRFELYTLDIDETLPQIQMGSISIGDKTLGNSKGPLELTRRVVFEKPFIGTVLPSVSLGLKMLDYSNENGQHRASVEARNITSKGFDCVFKRFDNLINDCAIDYTAIVKSNFDSKIEPTDREFKNANSLFFYKKSSSPSQ